MSARKANRVRASIGSFSASPRSPFNSTEVADEDDAGGLDAARGGEAVVARPVVGGDVVGLEVRELNRLAACERLHPDVGRAGARIKECDAAVVGQPDRVGSERGRGVEVVRGLAPFDWVDGRLRRGALAASVWAT